MNLPFYKFLASENAKQKKSIEDSSREAVRALISEIPSHEIVSEGQIGWLTCQEGDNWVEEAVLAVRLDRNRGIRLTCLVDHDCDFNPVIDDWDDPERALTFDEDDDYSSVRWTGLLSGITDFLERTQKNESR